jgi:calcium-dependent protein kinase
MYEYFQDEKRYYIITEICKGGELFEEIISKGSFGERDGSQIIK